MSNPISNLGTINTITIGGTQFADTTNVIQLYGFLGGATNIYSGLIKVGSGTSTAYQVTTGKTLTIFAIKLASASSVAENINIGYADAALALNSSSAPTNPVYFGTETSTTTGFISGVGAGDHAVVSLEMKGKLAAQKFGFVKSAGTASSLITIYAWGYET